MLADYDFTNGDNILEAFANIGEKPVSVLGHERFDTYQHPGDFLTNDIGNNKAKLKANLIAWQTQTILAEGNLLNLVPNLQFTLEHSDNNNDNGDYRIIAIEHSAKDITHTSHELEDNEIQQSYQNKLISIPAKLQYAPPQDIPKPEITNTQSAFVVGPKDKAVHTNEYGQVKVQFHWDRYGQNDENSSCWLRVLQPSSGSNWGTQFIPRIGDEVVVAFIDTDPDRPIIIGSVYNEANQEPYKLPDNQNISGLKTHIEDGSQSSRGHELLFDDTPGKERFILNSEGLFTVNVNNNATHTVKENETINVKGNNVLQVKKGQAKITAKELHLIVGDSSMVLDDNGVTIKPAGKLHLLAKDVGDAKPVARVGDNHKCPKKTGSTPHIGGPVLKGSPISKANGMAVARVGDDVKCNSGTDKIAQGVGPITADGKPIAKVNSQSAHGGVVVAGSPNVFVGETKGTTTSAPITETNQCAITKFTIQCGHGNRTFKLDGLSGKPTRKQDYVIQVIAGNTKPDKIKIQYQGQCKKGKNCPQLLITTPEKTYKQKPGELDVYSNNIAITKDFIGFFKQILIPNSEPHIYKVKPLTCNANDAHEVAIEAFAPIEWEGSVAVGYKFDTQKDSNFNQNQGWKKLKTKGEWILEGSISVKRNEEKWTLGADAEKEGSHYSKHMLTKQLFSHVQSFLDKIAAKLGSIKSDYGEIDITWPKLELNGKMKNIEIPDKYQTDTKGHIKIDMNPLIGITAEAKILNWLIFIASGTLFGKFLLKVKRAAAEGHKGKNVGAQADVNIILSAGMKIKGHVSWHKELQEPWKPKGEINDEIPLKLEGHAEGSVHLFIIKAKAGVEAGAKSAVGIKLKAGTETGNPTANMQLYFHGLVVYYSAYYDFEAQNIKHEKSTIPPSQTHHDSKKISFKKEYKNKYELFEPVYWPNKPKVMKLTEGAL